MGPKFFSWPPVRGVAHAFERLSLLPLVGGGLFLLVSGVLNTARVYPWDFYFPAAHYAAAWITVGGMIVHIALKSSVTRNVVFTRSRRESLPRRGENTDEPSEAATVPGPRTRRWFLGSVAGATGLFAAATAGNTIPFLSSLAALGQRIPGRGPQGLPVQTTAAAARISIDPSTYTLTVRGNVVRELSFSLADLKALPQREADLPIACVEGWSTSARWSGVSVQTLLDLAGAPRDSEAIVISAQRASRYRTSQLNRLHANNPDTLMALSLNGEPLHEDHGAPVRLIGPNRPGVMQTKWVTELRVL